MQLAVFCFAILLSCQGALAEGQTQNNKESREEMEWRRSARAAFPKIIEEYGEYIFSLSQANGIRPEIVVAIATVESLGNPWAQSKSGAKGILQTMPVADDETGIDCDSFDPYCSFAKGVTYLRILEERYGYRGNRRVVAYSRGPSAVREVENPGATMYFKRIEYILWRIPKNTFMFMS